MIDKQQVIQTLPIITYPAGLPVSEKVEEIKQVIVSNQVIIIAGATGSGKTTQIPKICLELGRGVKGLIGHTQPRRLAARTVAARIAQELDVKIGEEVGYQVRFKDNTTEKTLIKLMTDGVLLAEIQRDSKLWKYDTIIIDEAHERSLNIDFLLGYLKNLLPKRPQLKLIITSATIDVEKFSKHFNNAPVIEVSGRTYPVELIYRPPLEQDEEFDLPQNIISAIKEIQSLDKKNPVSHKNILVFLSGEKEIRDVAEAIRREKLPHMEVLPLYARLSNKEQNRVFQSRSGRRVVLATNVAETSLTVPGIGYVIDPGKARISRYSVRSKIQRLPIEAISQASANQRAGRCGRLCPGTCIRLYDEADFLARAEFTDTEITRTNLASVILQMLALNLGNIEDFPFLDLPESRAINDGVKLLEELGAINSQRRLSKKGRLLAKLPLDPKYGRMIIEAANIGCLREVLLIVSALSIQDPRERPLDKQQAADEKHRRFWHVESDFWAFIDLWDYYEQQRQELTQNQLRKFCQKNYLSFMRMREWREVHRQLHLVCKDLKFKQNQTPASYEQVHESLLSGLLGQVANRLETGEYLGARNRKFKLFPGSVLFKKKVKWILAAELVETSQLYARMNAKIEPQWLERLAKNLLKHHYFEPHWAKRKGRVMVFEKVSLYGLVIVEKRRVPFSAIDAVVSREIFIREALVDMQLNTQSNFYHHNKKQVARIEQIEEKTRRRDILINEESLFRFYDQQLPASVFDSASLERWYSSLSKAQRKALFLHESDLINDQVDNLGLDYFPDQIQTNSLSLPLEYEFNPGESADGISINVPVAALKQLKEEDLDWLVPGMLREKCIALVKALPKAMRKNFVPVPDYIDKVLPELSQNNGNLKNALSHQLRRVTGFEIPPQSWDQYKLADHLLMNINVIAENGDVLGQGRELHALREKFAFAVQQSISQHSSNSIEQEGLTEWSFGELNDEFDVSHDGITIKTFPAIVDEGTNVALRLLDSGYKAQLASQAGVVRLCMLKSPDQIKFLKKSLLQDPSKMLLLKKLGNRDKLLEQLIRTAYLEAFSLDKDIPKNKKQFTLLFDQGRANLIEIAEKVEDLLYRIMMEYREIQKELKKIVAPVDLHLSKDIHRQLDFLIFEDFLFQTPWHCLKELPRYLKGISSRLEKYPRQVKKDKEWTNELDIFWKKLQERKAYCEKQEIRNKKLDDFRWMLEEFRISIFAQSLKTRYPISAKRLQKYWQEQVIA